MDKGKQLYIEYKNGNEEALSELIALYRNSLTLFLYEIVKVYDIAEELMIESFSALIFAKVKFKGDSSFKTYLFAIARNLAFKYLRHNKRYESIENVQNEQVDIEKEFITKQQNIALYRVINQLDPEYQMVIYLIYFEGMSYAETAKIIKKTRKQVDNIAYRAKKLLKDKIKDEGLFNEE